MCQALWIPRSLYDQPAGRKGKRIYLVSCYVVSSGPNGWPFANLLLGPSFLPHILVMIEYCIKGNKNKKKVQFAKCPTYPISHGWLI